jgi:chromosomal replication initiation ATPase DnaA
MTSTLNPRLQFGTLRVGASSELAVSASRTVAERPGTVYNPLFLYGGTGVGKTHVLTAIGLTAQEVHPELTIEYVTPDRLAESFGAALSAGQSDAFRNRLRDVDVLLIDDVHLLAARREIQVELLRVITELKAAGNKQLVAAANRPPIDIEGLDQRLATEFGAGLVVDIAPPEYETRLAILQDRAEERETRFEEGVLEAVAAFEISNVRELITVLNRLLGLQAVGETRITPDAARALLAGEALAVADRADTSAARRPAGAVPDEFEDFLSDVSVAVQEQIDVWQAHLAEAIARYRGDGYETARLEGLRDPGSPMPVEAAITEFERDVAELRQLRELVAAVDARRADDSVFFDPDRVAEAQVLADEVTTTVEPLPAPSGAWTFDSYVPSEGNQTTEDAARATADEPGARHNPLVIIGAIGVGKSHLLHAIGNAVSAPGGTAVACLSAEDFHDAVGGAVAAGQLDQWQARYGRADALLVDDVHLLGGKDRSQEELVRLIDVLLGHRSQLAFTMNTEPEHIEGLSDDLMVRLQSGYLCWLTPPDRQLRRGLVVRLLDERVGSVDPDLADYLADRPAESTRGVMSLVRRVLDAADGRGTTPSAGLARELIEGVLPSTRRSTAGARTSGVVIAPSGSVRSPEKMIWIWPDPADRMIEELG